jgi:hypothetical protein
MYRERIKNININHVKLKQNEFIIKRNNRFYKTRGLPEISVDGVWGPETDKAYNTVLDFQNKESNLVNDGIYGDNTSFYNDFNILSSMPVDHPDESILNSILTQ